MAGEGGVESTGGGGMPGVSGVAVLWVTVATCCTVCFMHVFLVFSEIMMCVEAIRFGRSDTQGWHGCVYEDYLC